MIGAHRVGTAHDEARDAGVLVLPIRKDDVTKNRNEPDGLDNPYADGDFAVLEVDERGFLRVRVKDDQLKIASSPSVEELLEVQNSLLRRVVLALEMLHETSLDDPG